MQQPWITVGTDKRKSHSINNNVQICRSISMRQHSQENYHKYAILKKRKRKKTGQNYMNSIKVTLHPRVTLIANTKSDFTPFPILKK